MRIDQHPAVAVVVHVDETRRDNRPLAIDRLSSVAPLKTSDSGDAIAIDRNVGRSSRAAPVPSITVPPVSRRSYTCSRLLTKKGGPHPRDTEQRNHKDTKSTKKLA